MKTYFILIIQIIVSITVMAQSNPHLQLINPDNLVKSPAYSHIAQVNSGKIVFISGQVSVDEAGNIIGKGDIKEQTKQVYKNIEKALNAVGAQFSDVAKFSIYLKDMSKIPEFRQVRNELFDQYYYINQVNRPVSTAIGVTELFHPDWLIEIEAYVVLP